MKSPQGSLKNPLQTFLLTGNSIFVPESDWLHAKNWSPGKHGEKPQCLFLVLFSPPNYRLTVDESARIADPPADACGRQAEVFFLSAAFRAKQLCSASVPQTPASPPCPLERFPAAQPHPAVENVPSRTTSGDAHTTANFVTTPSHTRVKGTGLCK